MNCLKHVEFHAKIKFVKLVSLVEFIKKKFVMKRGHMNVKLTSQFGNAGLGLALCDPNSERSGLVLRT